MKSNRIEWVDQIKGFVILLVVAGHICDGYLNAGLYPEMNQFMSFLYHVIYSFHMPLFMTISGMMFYHAYCRHRVEKKEHYRRQLLNLILVYMIFSSGEWALKLIFSKFVNHPMDWYALLRIPVQPLGELWYIYILIFYYLFFYWKEGKEHLFRWLPLILFSVSVVCTLFQNHSEDILYKLLYYAFFFELGIQIQKRQWSWNMKSTWLMGTGMMLGLIVILWHNASVVGIRFFTACFCVLFFLSIFEQSGDLQFLKNGKKGLALFGTYSLEIYLIHCYITAANRLFLPMLGINWFYVNVLVNLLMALFIPIGISCILKKFHFYHFIFRPADLIMRKRI